MNAVPKGDEERTRQRRNENREKSAEHGRLQAWTDRNLVELFQMWRASRTQQLIHLRAPAALPYFFTGLRIGATLAPIGALVGDYTAGSSAGDGGGLGFQAIIYSSQAKYPALFATAAVTCVLGFIFVAVVLGFSWLTLRHWHESYARKDA